MILRSEILTTVKTALDAKSDFLDNLIASIIYTGSNVDDVEASLRDPGIAVVILPVIRYSPREQAAGAMVGDATFVIRLAINPTANAALSVPLDLETLREAISECLLAISADDHGDRFRLVSDELAESDPGLLAADLTFEKGCQVNPL